MLEGIEEKIMALLDRVDDLDGLPQCPQFYS